MNRLRSLATPLVTGAGVLTAVTGMLMFFHLRGRLTTTVHEWAGWLMLGAVALHLVVNWKALLHALRRPRALALVGACAAVAIVAVLPLGGRGAPPQVRAMQALLDAPLTAVAEVAQRTPDEVVAALADGGVEVKDSAGTLRALSAESHRPPAELLALALGGEDKARPRRGSRGTGDRWPPRPRNGRPHRIPST